MRVDDGNGTDRMSERSVEAGAGAGQEERAGLPAENVGDYPRPPSLEWVDWPIEVVLGGARIVAAPGAWRVLETFHPPTYYIDPAHIADGALRPVGGGSLCEWKGRARYFDVVAGGRTAQRAAWSYPSPTRRFEAIRDHVAIYAHAMDEASVAGVRVIPQPGDFYGGWTTPNVTGPIKGAPGTTHW